MIVIKVLQKEFVQYDTCNATAGSGRFKFNGYCNPDNAIHDIRLMLTLNSQNLMNTVNFMNNSFFYLTSMSHYNYSFSEVTSLSVAVAV